MKPSRIALYTLIALTAAVIAWYFLAKEPPPEWPINLIHLLTRH